MLGRLLEAVVTFWSASPVELQTEMETIRASQIRKLMMRGLIAQSGEKGETGSKSPLCDGLVIVFAWIAIQNQVPVWHDDPDFDSIARFTSLKIVKGIS